MGKSDHNEINNSELRKFNTNKNYWFNFNQGCNMPQDISEKRITCPHCGHHLHVTLDSSGGDQDYYDECPSCCKDIHFNLHIDEYHQKIQLAIDSDDEQVF